jgi:hypothetical protein
MNMDASCGVGQIDFGHSGWKQALAYYAAQLPELPRVLGGILFCAAHAPDLVQEGHFRFQNGDNIGSRCAFFHEGFHSSYAMVFRLQPCRRAEMLARS